MDEHPVEAKVRERNKAKTGFREIAEAAGVSVSTVDRVLNERGSVSAERRRRVLDAAGAFSTRRLLPDAWHGTCRIELILPRNRRGNPTPFWRHMDLVARHYAAGLPAHVAVHRTMVREGDLEELRAAILNPPVRRNALVIAADAVEAIAPLLGTVMARGEHVVTIVSDVPGMPPHPFAGVDNQAMGRTAGFLMSGLLHGEGEILLLQATARRGEHRERAAGFLDAVAARRPVHVLVTEEDADRTRALAASALREHAIAGIYLTGHTPGPVADLLRTLDRRPRWISHELSPEHAALLREDLLDFVLDQDPAAQIAWAIATAMTQCGIGSGPAPGKHPDFRIVCRENIGSLNQDAFLTK